MATSKVLTEVLDQLILLFNQRSMDLPDGCFTRHTQFQLNGVPFENMLGRSPQDPLVLMIARGPAGYRFTAKAVQHAVPDAKLERGELETRQQGDSHLLTGQCWLSGHFRGTGEAVELLANIEMRFNGGTLAMANVRMDPGLVQRLSEARIRD